MARQVITKTNLSPLIEIITWFGLTVSILTVIVRVVIKLKVVKRVDYDDYFIATSLMFAIAESISLSIATSHGLGQPVSAASDSDLDVQLKAEYAATLLFLTTCCLAKLSLLAFLRSLTRVTAHRTLNIALGTSIVLWAVTSFIPGAFQCGLPRPWDHARNKCFNRHAWEYYASIGNILTDLGLTFLPLFIVSGLKISTGRKIAVYMAFMGRLSVVAALITQLIFLIQRSSPTNDPSLDIWPVSLCTQFAQCLSIVSACTVYLKPFLDSLETGFIQVGGSRRQRIESHSYGSKQGSGIASTLTSIRGKLSSKDRTTVSSYPLQDRPSPSVSRPVNQVQTVIGSASESNRGDWDAHSQSQILQTRTWEVRDERDEEGRRESGIDNA